MKQKICYSRTMQLFKSSSFRNPSRLLKPVIFLSLTLLFAPATFAQQAAVSKLAQTMTDSLAYLQLTDQQKTSALSLNTTAATSLVQLGQKAKADTSFKGKALAKQVMGVMKQRNDGLKKILTPDQQKLYQQHQVERMADMQTKLMTTQLDLTDAQVPQVYQINLKEAGKMMGTMDDMKTTHRKLKKMREAKSLKSDSKEKDDALKQILSPDQFDKYQKNKEAQQAAMKEKMQQKKGQ